MLTPSDFTVGLVADATPLSLILPRSRYEHPLLIVRREEAAVAVFLGTEHRFESMDCADNEYWKGLIIPGVAIEVDETSLFDPDQDRATAGPLIRRGDKLVLCATADQRRSYGRFDILTVIDGLPATGERMEAGFEKWAITLGTGDDKRTLLKVDATAAQ